MEEVDFSKCAFIKEYMQYYTYADFCKYCKVIKSYYESLDKNAKIFYKWYVYANIHMNETYKNAIWCYLNSNDPMTYADLLQLNRKSA